MKNISEKVVEKIKTHVLSSVTIFGKSCRLSDNFENYCRIDRPQMTIRRMRFVSRITKATDTHSEDVTLIAFHSNDGYKKEAHC